MAGILGSTSTAEKILNLNVEAFSTSFEARLED